MLAQQLTARPAVAPIARRAQQAGRCTAVASSAQPAASGPSRRAFFASALVAAPLLLNVPAFALILDEEDDEANAAKLKELRKSKIQAEKTAEREFLQSEGLSKSGGFKTEVGEWIFLSHLLFFFICLLS